MPTMDRQQEFVLRTLEERDIRFVRLWFTDVSGYLKAVAVAPAEIEAAFAEGIGFDGSAIEGFARVYESDMLAKPDPATFQVMPPRDGRPSDTARMFCDITLPDGSAALPSARRSTCRGSAQAGEPSGRVMSQNIRAVSLAWPAVAGSTWNVPGSGLASMSDS